MKRVLALVLALLTALSLCACKINLPGMPGASGRAHEELMANVRGYLDMARGQEDAGMTSLSEFYYGRAQAEISSLRLCIDRVLWLLGEGKNFTEVVGSAHYRDWDSIVGSGPNSGAPFYFEGLLMTFQGKKAEAAELYRKASAHPGYKDSDFYYLRRMSVDELYALKERPFPSKMKSAPHTRPARH